MPSFPLRIKEMLRSITSFAIVCSSMDELSCLLGLSLVLSAKQARTLYVATQSSTKAFASLPLSLQEKAERLALLELAECKKLNVSIIPYFSSQFPQKLKMLSDCPLLIYVQGTLCLEERPQLAIIGTRAATDYGKQATFHFSKTIAAAGVCIVSGLARGIDTEAHKATLGHGQTIAIIGSGLGSIYPKENEPLAKEIVKHGGAVLSELPIKTPPSRFSFPKRNRLIAALSSALLLTEAPKKSGAMGTMELGFLFSKKLYALPGRALQEQYEGNHLLIQQGKAKLVTAPEEIIKEFGIILKNSLHKNKGVKISETEEKVLEIISQSEVSVDELFHKSCLPISCLHATLMQLILKDLAVELPGKRFRKK
jgi:DNA processing protein